ncbi:MAG: flagellin [Acidobacteriota bacterium]|jgi:flagellin|nr:flagellin [Acidobacteriota bacterium]
MGSFSILNNISGLTAQNQLNSNNVSLSKTLTRLSTGKRINTGADDAAGLQIADSLRANTFALNQAVRNANDGIGVAQIADGALQEITNLLTRSVTLTEQAATDTVDSTGRASLNAEFEEIEAEIARIAASTNFNGTLIFGTGSDDINGEICVFVGDINGNSSIAVSIGTISADAGTGVVTDLGGTGTPVGLTGVDLTTATAAKDSLDDIKAALNAVSNMRADIGAGMNRLSSAVSVLQTQAQNTSAAESTIRDANFAEEVANLTKFQILSQSGMAALAQANSSSQSVLSLLR